MHTSTNERCREYKENINNNYPLKPRTTCITWLEKHRKGEWHSCLSNKIYEYKVYMKEKETKKEEGEGRPPPFLELLDFHVSNGFLSKISTEVICLD